MAFRKQGFNAYSCDLQKARFDPNFHILGDVTPYLKGKTSFITQNGDKVKVKRWHLIIAHPPCTYLCKVSSVWMIKDGIVQEQRYNKMLQARDFFYTCLDAQCDYLAVENPIPMARAQLPRPSCFIHPSWFGVKYTKKTLYWLRNLPPLVASIDYPNPKEFVHASRGKYRSRTFPQVAEAIATQWGSYVIWDMNRKCTLKTDKICKR